MAMFKVGDVVKCINAMDSMMAGLYYGCIYTVKEAPSPDSSLILLEEIPGYWDYTRFVYIGEKEKPTPLKDQVGGDHYKNMKIQPVDYIHANNLGFIEGCVIKYISRYKTKNGKQDLEKARHFINMLIELEYPNQK